MNAAVVDYVVVPIVCYALLTMASVFFGLYEDRGINHALRTTFMFLLFAPLLLYPLIKEGFSGRSLGQRLQRLRVVEATTGDRCGLHRSLLRNLPVPLIWLAGMRFHLPGVLVIIGAYAFLEWWKMQHDPEGRRWADHLAGTRVELVAPDGDSRG